VRKAALGFAISAVLLSVPPAFAQSILEFAAGVRFCGTVKDDAQRLKCYDGLSQYIALPSSPTPVPKGSPEWSIKQSKSSVDGSRQVEATLIADKRLLVLRCREQKTEAVFGGEFTFLGSSPVKVLVRFNDGQPITSTWQPSTSGQGAFAPEADEFIRALPDNGKLFIQAFGFQRSPSGFQERAVEGTFELGNVSAVREKIAAACNWSAASQAAGAIATDPH
jgi:hypothetical protein